jgi:hypothetical protein
MICGDRDRDRDRDPRETVCMIGLISDWSGGCCMITGAGLGEGDRDRERRPNEGRTVPKRPP